MNKKFLSTTEVAKLLNISRVSVFKKIKSGELKAEKIGRNYIVPIENVAPFLKEEIDESTRNKIVHSVDKVMEDFGETIKRLGND